VIPDGDGAEPWTLETRVIAAHVRPGRRELDTPRGRELHRTLGRWLPTLHAFGGFPSFGTWQASGPATLAGHVLPRASAVRARAAGLGNGPPARAPRQPGAGPARTGHPRRRLAAAPAATRRVRHQQRRRHAGRRRSPGGGGRVRLRVGRPGDPVEDFLRTADHGLESPRFRSFLAGYLTRGQLDPGAPERFAFYQLEHCLHILGWARQRCPEIVAQSVLLIEQVLDGARLRLG
jgi:hypothetical protein